MSETVAKNMEAAQAQLNEVEKVTAVVLAEPKNELVTLDEADAPTSAEITQRMNELDMTDTASITSERSSSAAARRKRMSRFFRSRGS